MVGCFELKVSWFLAGMFCLVLTTLLGLIAPKGLDTNWTLGPPPPPPLLGDYPLQLTDHNAYSYRLNVPVHGRCGEIRSPKIQPSTRPGIEPSGTFWLAIRDRTNCVNLARTRHSIQILYKSALTFQNLMLITLLKTKML